MMVKNNLEQYRVFYIVAKCGSLTEAAKELSITQPAVSQAIKLLEDSVSTKLFQRTAKGVKLTKEGEILYAHVEKGYEQFALGEKALEQMLNIELGEIKIGASDMTLQYFLLPFLEKFHESFPNIKISVTNVPTPETLSNLEEGKIDFGIVTTPFVLPTDIESIAVQEVEDVFVAGRRFISYKNHMLDFKDLENMQIICLEGNTSSRSYIEQLLKEKDVVLNPEFELATSEMIVQFALRNLGIGYVVKDFAREFIEEGSLFELRFNQMIPKRQICIVRNKKSPLSAAAGKLFEMISR